MKARVLAALLAAVMLTGCTLVRSLTPCGTLAGRPCYQIVPEPSCDDLVLHEGITLTDGASDLYWTNGCGEVLQPEDIAKLPLRTRLRMRWEEWKVMVRR